jgi:hypothetical protein
MKNEIKEALADIVGNYKLGVMNTEALVVDIVNGLKEKDYQINKIVKFKVGDVIGTDCGNRADTVITLIKDGVIHRSLIDNLDDNGDPIIYDIDTYENLIKKGYRVKR